MTSGEQSIAEARLLAITGRLDASTAEMITVMDARLVAIEVQLRRTGELVETLRPER